MSTATFHGSVPALDSDDSALVARLRATFDSGRTRSAEWRIDQLRALERLLTEREADLVAALATDLGRPKLDAYIGDIAPVLIESRFARRHLRSWMRRKYAWVPRAVQPGLAWSQCEPLGVTLVVGPWNYPVCLNLAPLVGALAAGNCVIVKPSEQAPAVSALLAEFLPRYLDSDAVAVAEGSGTRTQSLLQHGLDHVFFTGGPTTGKAVLASAAEHLTPVTLELGGKSPVIVADDADLRVAARRIAWIKGVNSGQTCVAPDYVLISDRQRERFVAELRAAIAAFGVGRDSLLPLVHTDQATRMRELLAASGGRVVHGGKIDTDSARAEFTVVIDPEPGSPLLTDEIFGPILPVVAVDSVEAAITHVRQGPKPLAVYLFSSDRAVQRRVVTGIGNGGTVINHLMLHLLVPGLPFGGVGNSGTGNYHGRWGFETFSHRKAVLRKPTMPDPNLCYPPYSTWQQWLLRKVF